MAFVRKTTKGRPIRQGAPSSCKKKTITLLSPGADPIPSAETPTQDWVRRLGPAPDIYSREINDWLMAAAIDLLKNRRDLGCLYIHLSDA
ncbi:MAG: hypothetical protein LAP61_27905 [Acidobacteriia bacterium]|nr:hypothetical protein [Terriglobia bacterium]